MTVFNIIKRHFIILLRPDTLRYDELCNWRCCHHLHYHYCFCCRQEISKYHIIDLVYSFKKGQRTRLQGHFLFKYLFLAQSGSKILRTDQGPPPSCHLFPPHQMLEASRENMKSIKNLSLWELVRYHLLLAKNFIFLVDYFHPPP